MNLKIVYEKLLQSEKNYDKVFKRHNTLCDEKSDLVLKVEHLKKIIYQHLNEVQKLQKKVKIFTNDLAKFTKRSCHLNLLLGYEGHENDNKLL